jgi:hypothetical protein
MKLCRNEDLPLKRAAPESLAAERLGMKRTTLLIKIRSLRQLGLLEMAG